MSDRTVIVKTGFGDHKYHNAYLQADDSTILIRQAFPDQPKAYTITAVYAPGMYLRAFYEHLENGEK